MYRIQELIQNESLCCSLATFLDQHGFSGLEKALQLYSNTQAEYICKTKATVTRTQLPPAEAGGLLWSEDHFLRLKVACRLKPVPLRLKSPKSTT